MITFNYPGDSNHVPSSGNFLLVTDRPSTPSTTGAGAPFLGLPTNYWIIVAIGIAGVGAFIAYLVMFKNRKKDQPNIPVTAPSPPPPETPAPGPGPPAPS
jgi:hypothetical protein